MNTFEKVRNLRLKAYLIYPRINPVNIHGQKFQNVENEEKMK